MIFLITLIFIMIFILAQTTATTYKYTYNNIQENNTVFLIASTIESWVEGKERGGGIMYREINNDRDKNN